MPQGRCFDTLSSMPPRSRDRRFLATVVVTDIVASTARAEELGDQRWRKLLDRHDSMVRARLKRFGGREVKMMGDGVLATFDMPADAAECAREIVTRAAGLGLAVRGGVHSGECEERGDDLGGIAVHLATRIASQAAPGEVLVSSTVKDLVTGSDLRFESRGTPELKGVAEPWALFAVLDAPATTRAGARTRRPAASPARVLLVDDHPLWRQTLRGVLRHSKVGQVVAEADDGEQAVLLAGSEVPDVVVMDIDLPSMNGIEATRRILDARPQAKVLVLSSSDERQNVLDAVRAGAAGYLLKTAGSADIIDGIRRVHAGELVFPARLAEVVLSEMRGTGAEEAAPTRVAVHAVSALDRDGLARVVADAGFDVTVAAKTLDEIVDAPDGRRPEVVITELGGRAAATVEQLDRLRAAHPTVGLVVLTREPDTDGIVSLVDQDWRGLAVMLQERVTEVAELVDTIRRVAAGDSAIDPQVARRLVERPRRRPTDELTEREMEVLGLMAEGRSNQAICERLHVSAKTVEGYVSSIFSKLGLEVAADDHRRVLAVVAYLGSR